MKTGLRKNLFFLSPFVNGGFLELTESNRGN